MKILVLTPIYPASTNPAGATPVVHYFTKEWVKMNHEVHVCHLCAKYPSFFYLLARCFHSFISSKTGMIAPVYPPRESTESLDGVKIFRIAMTKFVPHGRYRRSVIDSSIKKIIKYFERESKPDIIVGHWLNPQLEVLSELKNIYRVPICLVLHESASAMINLYKTEVDAMISGMDLVGFRSMSLKESFERTFDSLPNNFLAYSGVPDVFIEQNTDLSFRTFQHIENFIFVGSLIKRKYPTEILSALFASYGNSCFSIKYIGEGREKKAIMKKAERLNISSKVALLGRMDRNAVIDFLKKSDIFVMISKNEVFGLVYLEAMALGCIIIASRGEGFDGIIIDGMNGFLCEAGNAQELASIIMKIRNLTPLELREISNRAVHTARCLTDSAVAKSYLDSMSKLLK